MRFLAHVQSQNTLMFQRLHWTAVEEVMLHGRPHMRMEADLARYPPFRTPEAGLPRPSEKSGLMIGENHPVVIAGSGQAGLSVSACLRDREIEHVIFEKHRVSHAWRSQRWDSFCLVTPNWQCQLPGFPYAGPGPKGITAGSRASHKSSTQAAVRKIASRRAEQQRSGLWLHLQRRLPRSQPRGQVRFHRAAADRSANASARPAFCTE